MQTSWAGIRFVCRQEAFVATAYPDPFPRFSKGFGGLANGPNESITIEDAIRAVSKHVQDNDVWMNRRIRVPILQHEWDAFASFYYQNGNKQNGRDIIAMGINTGDPTWIDQLANFDMNSKGEHKPGLKRRREREIALAKNADYGDIEKYGVYAGTPLTLVEWRAFPLESEI